MSTKDVNLCNLRPLKVKIDGLQEFLPASRR